MMKPTNTDMNEMNEDEHDETLNNGMVQTPCHDDESSNITEPFGVESSTTATTFGFGHSYSNHQSKIICCCCCTWLRQRIPALDHLKKNWKILALGQLISFSLAAGGAALATLNLDCHLSAPTFVVSLYYFLLSWHIVILWRRTTNNEMDGNESSILSKRKRNRHQPLDTDDSSPDLALPANYVSEVHASVSTDTADGDITDEVQVVASPQHSFFGLFPLKKPMWRYCILALIDVEANAITALSFRYTTLTSITLFDNLAIPTAMVLSRCLFARRYTFVHLSGVLICMVGVVLNMIQDYDDDQSIEEQQEYPHKLQGDLCAITGGILYGVSNVMVEVTIRDSSDSAEYLGIMGFFAFILATIQAWIVEADEILEFFGSHLEGESRATCHSERWWMLTAYVGSTAFAYVGASQFFQISEATFFALSLLTGDLWSVIFSIFFEHIVPHPLFFLALVFVLSGMIMYEMAPSPVLEDRNVVLTDDADELEGSTPISGNSIDASSDYVAATEDEEDHYSGSGGSLT